MARIILNTGTLVGRKLISLNQQLIDADAECRRLLAIVNQITNAGTQKANLETSPESLTPVGSGTAIYNGIVSIQTSLTSLADLISAIDQG